MIINKPFDCKAIIHTADLHIQDDKLAQFETNFDNMLDKCVKKIESKGISPENVLWVNIGDLFDNHSKKHNFETLLAGAKSLHKILNCGFHLLQTIGNHDYDINNKNKMDYITPLYEIYNRFGSNIVFDYMKHSGWYYTNNLAFKHYSIWDDFIVPSSQLNLDLDSKGNKKRIIGLFHDCLDSSINFNGLDITKYSDHKYQSTNIFEGCSAVLMGDIHRPQEINNEFGIPIVYCGSAWQLNAGETISNHSVPIWFIDDHDIYYERIQTSGVIEYYKYSYDGENFLLKNE